MHGWVIGAALAAGVGLLGAAGTAWAQDSAGNIPHVTDRLRASVGAMVATSRELRDDGADAWFLVDITFDLQHPSPTRSVDFAAFFDAAFNNQSSSLDHGNYDSADHNYMHSFYGIGISSRVRLTPPSRHFGIFGTGGVGIYSLGRSEYDSFYYNTGGGTDPITGDPVYTGSDSYTRDEYSRNTYQLGYKFGLGFHFGRGLFLESTYFNLGKLDDRRYSGVGLTFGARL